VHIVFPGIARLITLSAAIALAACGGGSGGGGGTSTSVPGGLLGSSPGSVGSSLPPADAPASEPSGTITRVSNGCSLEQATGDLQDNGLKIEEVNWIQVVQQNVTDPRLRLVANKALRLRVDVTAPTSGQPLPAAAILRVALDSGGCRDYPLTTSATTAPKRIDRSTLANSYVAVIPAADVSTDIKSIQFAVDAERQSSVAAADRLYVELPVNIGAETSEEIVTIPVLFQGQPGHFATNDSMAALVSRTFPLARVAVTSHAPVITASLVPGKAISVSSEGIYTFGYQEMLDTLSDIESQCYDLNPGFATIADGKKCAGVYPATVRFIDNRSGSSGGELVGLSYVGGFSLLSKSFDATDNSDVSTPYGLPWLTLHASYFIHELGHILNLDHANCGTPSGIDTDLYSDGSLGEGGGFDVGRGFYFSGSVGPFYDVMSYCGVKTWMSDRGYQKMANYKYSSASAGMTPRARGTGDHATAASEQKGIRVVRRNGAWQVYRTMIPAAAVNSVHAKDGGFIHAALSGLPVRTLNTDLGQSRNGPFYLPVDDQLLQQLGKGMFPGITLY